MTSEAVATPVPPTMVRRTTLGNIDTPQHPAGAPPHLAAANNNNNNNNNKNNNTNNTTKPAQIPQPQVGAAGQPNTNERPPPARLKHEASYSSLPSGAMEASYKTLPKLKPARTDEYPAPRRGELLPGRMSCPGWLFVLWWLVVLFVLAVALMWIVSRAKTDEYDGIVTRNAAAGLVAQLRADFESRFSGLSFDLLREKRDIQSGRVVLPESLVDPFGSLAARDAFIEYSVDQLSYFQGWIGVISNSGSMLAVFTVPPVASSSLTGESSASSTDTSATAATSAGTATSSAATSATSATSGVAGAASGSTTSSPTVLYVIYPNATTGNHSVALYDTIARKIIPDSVLDRSFPLMPVNTSLPSPELSTSNASNPIGMWLPMATGFPFAPAQYFIPSAVGLGWGLLVNSLWSAPIGDKLRLTQIGSGWGEEGAMYIVDLATDKLLETSRLTTKSFFIAQGRSIDVGVSTSVAQDIYHKYVTAHIQSNSDDYRRESNTVYTFRGKISGVSSSARLAVAYADTSAPGPGASYRIIAVARPNSLGVLGSSSVGYGVGADAGIIVAIFVGFAIVGIIMTHAFASPMRRAAAALTRIENMDFFLGAYTDPPRWFISEAADLQHQINRVQALYEFAGTYMPVNVMKVFRSLHDSGLASNPFAVGLMTREVVVLCLKINGLRNTMDRLSASDVGRVVGEYRDAVETAVGEEGGIVVPSSSGTVVAVWNIHVSIGLTEASKSACRAALRCNTLIALLRAQWDALLKWRAPIALGTSGAGGGGAGSNSTLLQQNITSPNARNGSSAIAAANNNNNGIAGTFTNNAAVQNNAALVQKHLTHRVGIVSGPVTFGNTGTQQHRKFDVFGPAVSLAQHLAAVAPGYASEMLISDDIFKQVSTEKACLWIDTLQMSDRSLVPIYDMETFLENSSFMFREQNRTALVARDLLSKRKPDDCLYAVRDMVKIADERKPKLDPLIRRLEARPRGKPIEDPMLFAQVDPHHVAVSE